VAGRHADGSRALGDLPPPALVTARGALRRSLVVWGWGQVATGSRQGLLFALLEAAWLGLLGFVAARLMDGTTAVLLFLAGAGFLAVWVGLAVHAYRRAVRRREVFDLPAADGGSIELLWLAPVVILAASGFWLLAGHRGSADAVLADYVDAWRNSAARDVDAASAAFATSTSTAVLGGAWERQTARLRNAVIGAAAQAGPQSGIDPDEPFGSVRFVIEPDSRGRERRIEVEIVRRETVRDSFFGILPTTSSRFAPVSTIGSIDLVLVTSAALWDGGPAPEEWRIRGIDLLGEQIGEVRPPGG
jgi:hypothetical protein